MRRFFTKVTAAFLLTACLLGSVVQPPRAQAQFAVIDAANLAVNTSSSVSEAGQLVIQNVLNGLAWTLAKVTIQSITRSTVNWINSGFKGSPAFISDLTDNLKYLGDAVADDFFNQLNQTVVGATGFNLTSPFQDQISQQLRAEYYRTTSGLLGVNQYNLNTQSTDPKAFIDGQFSKGGFNAFFSANGNPANNPFGAYQLASNQLSEQLTAATQQRKAELDWGKGFLPWRGNCAQANTQSLSKAETCRQNPVRTPGSVIESQLELSLGTGIRQLELADSVNEVVGALMGQLVNQVLGAGGLAGASQPASGGGSSYIDQATTGSQNNTVTSSLSSGVLQNIQNDISNFQNMRDEWQRVLTTANAAQQRCAMLPEITSATTRATSNISKAVLSLQAIAGIQQQVQTAVSSTAVNKSTQITTAIASYQSFLAAPTTPSSSDIGDAARESTDTSATPNATQSTYSRMVTLQVNCAA